MISRCIRLSFVGSQFSNNLQALMKLSKVSLSSTPCHSISISHLASQNTANNKPLEQSALLSGSRLQFHLSSTPSCKKILDNNKLHSHICSSSHTNNLRRRFQPSSPSVHPNEHISTTFTDLFSDF